MVSLGRNEPCHCGSGKKYKKCHLAKDEVAERKALEKMVFQPKGETTPKTESAGKKPPPKTEQGWLKKFLDKAPFFKSSPNKTMGGA